MSWGIIGFDRNMVVQCYGLDDFPGMGFRWRAEPENEKKVEPACKCNTAADDE